MKPRLSFVVAMLLAPQLSWGATGDAGLDALIDKLVDKGALTADDARDLENEIAKKEPKATSKEASKPKLPFELKIRGQTRLDVGDLLVGPDGRYRTERDLFLRRVRLEAEKKFRTPPVGRELELNLTLDADRFDQELRGGRRRNPSNSLDLHYLYGDWIFIDQFGLEIGKHKQPFLRVELTSSGKQLLIERPASSGAAKDTFGGYHQTQVMAHGDVAGGALRYYLSYSDGAGNLDALQDLDSDAVSVQRRGWGKAFIGRVEVAPLGFPDGSAFTERKRDDTGIGADNHLTLGFDGGFQRDIRYATSSVADASLSTQLISVDLSGRYSFGDQGTLTGQLEYVNFRRDYSYKRTETPQGGYLQAGYLLPWTVLRGRLEPVARYEVFERDAVSNKGETGSRESILSIGFNHYLSAHSIKWAYNFVHTRFDGGVAETAKDTTKDLHELMLQLYF